MFTGVLILYGIGMFLWGHHVAMSLAKSDMQRIEKKMQDSKRCNDVKGRE